MSFLHRKERDKQIVIARTGFYVSLISYVVFWVAELMRPGFVSRYLSVHIFLLALVVCGVWWVLTIETYKDRRFFQQIIAVFLGFGAAVVLWNLGEGFQEYRVLMALLALMIPSIALKLLRSYE